MEKKEMKQTKNVNTLSLNLKQFNVTTGYSTVSNNCYRVIQTLQPAFLLITNI